MTSYPKNYSGYVLDEFSELVQAVNIAKQKSI